MQIQALQTVQDSGWAPAYDWWSNHQVGHVSGFDVCASWIETVPVLSATVLGLELLLQDRSLDLQMASELILRDVGATLHIMRLCKNAQTSAETCPTRMADCLAMLDSSIWFEALAANSLPLMAPIRQISALWSHSRCVAHYAKLLAESLGEISPEEAYVAGLLHEVENIPSLLGRKGNDIPSQGPRLNQILPPSLMQALQMAKKNESGSIWRYVLASAHALATSGTQSSSPDAKAFAKPFVV